MVAKIHQALVLDVLLLLRHVETSVLVSDVDLLVPLVLLVSILFQSTSRCLIFLIHWAILLVLRVLEPSSLVLA